MEKLKGFKTILFQVINMIMGGVVGAGLLTPELGADVTANVQAAVSQLEVLVGSFMALSGATGVAIRAVTNTPVFKKQ